MKWSQLLGEYLNCINKILWRWKIMCGIQWDCKDNKKFHQALSTGHQIQNVKFRFNLYVNHFLYFKPNILRFDLKRNTKSLNHRFPFFFLNFFLLPLLLKIIRPIKWTLISLENLCRIWSMHCNYKESGPF